MVERGGVMKFFKWLVLLVVNYKAKRQEMFMKKCDELEKYVRY